MQQNIVCLFAPAGRVFIDKALNPIIRAPAERNVPTLAGRQPYVSLRWSEENLSAVACSINISLRWSESQPDCCTWKLNPPFLILHFSIRDFQAVLHSSGGPGEVSTACGSVGWYTDLSLALELISLPTQIK